MRWRQMLNTCIDFTLGDGTTVPLTLQFYALYKLQAADMPAFERYNKTQTQGAENVFDIIGVIYAAYCCGAILSEKEYMSFEEFLQVLPPNHNTLTGLYIELLNPKKN